ncbi:hypothetical protein [Aquabacter spiritensis]|uniref:Copper binding protein CusF n=1 Tax=Aquabacter spiritensis TaxID=933073 RepID=A0A4V2UX79_9HYPH|nr:hypothetical protein [Aquabacter spiritensis]TCT02448.1 hypothetical protein EDC64_11398 [Aquabacter spiritensis]
MNMRSMLAAGLLACLPSVGFAADPILAVGFVVKDAITAKVSAVDAKSRTVTLVGPKGNWLVVKASPEMQNFPQIKVGDTVAAAMEQITEISVVHANDGTPVPVDVKTLDTAPAGARPGMIVTDRREIAATITAIAADTRTVTLQGPAGNSVDIKVPGDQDGFKKLSVGDHVIFRQITVAGIADIGK